MVTKKLKVLGVIYTPDENTLTMKTVMGGDECRVGMNDPILMTTHGHQEPAQAPHQRENTHKSSFTIPTNLDCSIHIIVQAQHQLEINHNYNNTHTIQLIQLEGSHKNQFSRTLSKTRVGGVIKWCLRSDHEQRGFEAWNPSGAPQNSFGVPRNPTLCWGCDRRQNPCWG